jgi:hypothetical protein
VPRSLESLIAISGRCADLLWLRYPGVCPSCLQRVPQVAIANDWPKTCSCEGTILDDVETPDLRGTVQALRLLGEERRSTRPATIDHWQQLLATIYSRTLSSASLWQITAMVLEEIGSVSDAIVRLYSYSKGHPPTPEEVGWRRTRFELELARVINLLFLVTEKSGGRLSTIVEKRYGPPSDGALSCWSCGKRECECPLLIAPHDVDIDKLISLMGL